MYTTIEPRLIALLNNDVPSDSYTPSPSLALPPLQDPNILKASGRPVLLEPDASKRNEQLQHATLNGSHEEDESLQQGKEKQQKAGSSIGGERALGISSPQSLRKILDDEDQQPIVISKKRHIQEKDEFVQLPQPPKKQKAVKQVVPPIIIGLFEPPPQATLFPPIASSSFHDSHGRNTLNTAPHVQAETEEESREPDAIDEPEGKTKPRGKAKKGGKARNKWTEEETNQLLLGVHKHGVGCWRDILDDPSFSFNGRSGSDLKDRFRTCCPAELRQKSPSSRVIAKPKSSLMSENILIQEAGSSKFATEKPDSNPRKSRAHRKRMEDLAQLGIGGFRKSIRRERRPFSEDEDREILEGYKLHGPAWSRIQRDPRFHLQERQPTDLRDRFRNKFPDKFRSDEMPRETSSKKLSRAASTRDIDRLLAPGTEFATPQNQAQDTNRHTQNVTANDVSVNNTKHLKNSLQPLSSREGLRIQEIISTESPARDYSSLSAQNSIFQPKEGFTFAEQSSMEPLDGTTFTQPFDWSGTIAAPFSNTMGEMDISRLLLEPWAEIPNASLKERSSFADMNNTMTASADPNHQSFYHLLNGDAEQMDDLQDATFD